MVLLSESGSLSDSNVKGAQLPYDCVNLIFEYLSHLLDSKWRLTFDAKGRVYLRYNRYYKPLHLVSNLFDYKYHLISRCNMGGQHRHIDIHYVPSNTIIQTEALQNYRSIVDQDQYNANVGNGFIDCGVCYTYNHPISGGLEVIYVDWRTHIEEDDTFTFLRGTLHSGADGMLHNIEDYELSEDGSITIMVQEMPIDWVLDFEGEPIEDNWIEDFEPLIDYEQLEAEALLQMYN